MPKLWSDDAWEDYLWWQAEDKRTLKRINKLIEDALRNPYEGLGKPEKLKVNLNIEYVAMEIPNDFIVGYGLDYDGFGRNYPDIYTVVD